MDLVKITYHDVTEYEEVEYEKEFLKGLKVGDKVALHWKFAAHLLSEEQAFNLEKYTKRNVDAMKGL